MPKSNALIRTVEGGVGASDFRGTINTLTSGVLDVSFSEHIVGVNAPNKTTILAFGCALPIENIKSILDNAYTLWLHNNAIVVNINLSGGTNAAIDLNDISAVHGISYEDIRGGLTTEGTVTLNEV